MTRSSARPRIELPEPASPPSVQFRWALAALRWYYAPECLHLDRASAHRPTLFVANHSVFNVFDAMLFADVLYREKGIVLRPLGDRGHFRVPLWRELVMQHGGVLGNRENCSELMRRGAHILVYPGGGREVFKRKREKYRLVWKDRYGFVRLAIEHGYTITPFVTAGAEESLDVLLDAGDYLRTPLGRLLKSSGLADRYLRGGEELPPLVRGVGLSMLPRPERMCFAIGKPIATKRHHGRHEDPMTLHRVRDQVARAMYGLMTEARRYRNREMKAGAVRRVFNRL